MEKMEKCYTSLKKIDISMKFDHNEISSRILKKGKNIVHLKEKMLAKPELTD